MALDDFMADPEAEAGASDLFGGEEGLEDSGRGVGGHSRSGVGDGENQAFASCLPVGAFATAYQEAASVGMHGVDGVDDQVAQDLANLSFEAEDRML